MQPALQSHHTHIFLEKAKEPSVRAWLSVSGTVGKAVAETQRVRMTGCVDWGETAAGADGEGQS